MHMSTYDLVIIGGGPAGLSAAVYAGRALHSVLVLDQADGRWNHHQHNENYLGFPNGVSAQKLRALGKKQAQKFGATFVDDRILTIKKYQKGFSLKGNKATYKARAIILCTGVKDHFPSFPKAETYIGRSLFWCLLCDGYKLQEKRVAVLGFDDAAVETCRLLQRYTKKMIFLTNCDETGDKISPEKKALLQQQRIPLHYGSIEKVIGARGILRQIILDTGEHIDADVLFSRQGATPNVELAQQLAVILEGKGYIKTDINKRTNVPLVYAAGDVTNETAHQIATAVFEGATAAISADHDLREQSGRS